MAESSLYAAALEAIRALFGDTSVTPATARRRLQGLRDEIDVMIETLPDDDGAEEALDDEEDG